MAINNDDVIRVEVNMLFDDTDRLMHVFHYQLDAAAPIDDAVVAGAIVTDFVVHYGALAVEQSDGLDYTYAGFYNITQDYPMADVGLSAVGSGSETGTTLPLQASGLVLFRTATKRSVGKKFIPGLMTAQTVDGQAFDTGTVTALATWAAGILSPVTPAGGTLRPGNYNKALDSFRPWISYLARPGVYTQRRRRPGAGQ
jgi:hypothetical protein